MRDNVRTGRSRGPSFTDNNLGEPTPLAAPGPFHAQQMTYFLADEKTMEASQSQTSSTVPKHREAVKTSLSPEATSGSKDKDNDEHDDKVGSARQNWKRNLMQHMSRGSEESLARSRSSSPRYSTDISRNASPSQPRRPSQSNVSRPYTPLIFESPAPGSALSSPRSRRDSDVASYTDEIASQAIVSSGDEGEADPPSGLMDSGSAPQLVMPSIRMPSRRPFTDRGKDMGRLKVLVAGDSGIGKTSLIKAIVQSCEDIVHVDPISVPPASTLSRRKSSKARSKSADLETTTHITEVYASTRAYPAWWSDLEESRILRRRKSVGDSVLERNLCFVDTPGYGTATSCLDCIDPIISYIESHLQKVTSTEASDSDLINMLSGGGGSQVDAIFYVISQSKSIKNQVFTD
ncbi:heat shock protein [Phlyctema vagabunda]|uniref:Heat shock protein n=1 Tax=Phlyctema vagabunda TaxID=108571 RepID=A0ABR4PPL4_9HELO